MTATIPVFVLVLGQQRHCLGGLKVLELNHHTGPAGGRIEEEGREERERRESKGGGGEGAKEEEREDEREQGREQKDRKWRS